MDIEPTGEGAKIIPSPLSEVKSPPQPPHKTIYDLRNTIERFANNDSHINEEKVKSGIDKFFQSESSIREALKTKESFSETLGQLNSLVGDMGNFIFYRNLPYFHALWDSVLKIYYENLPTIEANIGELDEYKFPINRFICLEAVSYLASMTESKKAAFEFLQRQK